MDSLVIELQQAALSREKSISELLRMAYVVAMKLESEDFSTWIEHELNGYPGTATRDLPAFRRIAGQVKGRDSPDGQWRPILFNNRAVAEALSMRPLNNAAPELEALTGQIGRRQEDGYMAVRYPPLQEEKIRTAVKADLEIQLHFTRSVIVRILDAIRTNVLKWTLELERAGIRGADMQFSEAEREAAKEVRIEAVLDFSLRAAADEISDVGADEPGAEKEALEGGGTIAEFLADLKDGVGELDLDKQRRKKLRDALRRVGRKAEQGDTDPGSLAPIRRLIEEAPSSPKSAEYLRRIGSLGG
jgi:hypothetical protein